jgi:hypothetical protein
MKLTLERPGPASPAGQDLDATALVRALGTRCAHLI